MKIYFAGSIRGGRDDGELYARLIGYLKRYGTVLTEHVGDAALLAEEQDMSEEAIFGRDMQWLSVADLVVAEVSTPSLGVGFEIATAQAMGKDICCLYRKGIGRRLSAMISGNRQITLFPYVTADEAEAIIATFVEQFVK
ncbi:MAG: nucleoside 2-deoxyribosyltransferase [Proteobacteria bacterium]|nr:nucleoside 2-deoxyribosyltransferase [Desulfobulbaceae bacterium]MBU4152067.1 nucleoside 2-deoxyribosyltransferase [Pseudomonadota bacterium]